MAGYTFRVYNLIAVLQDLNANKYHLTELSRDAESTKEIFDIHSVQGKVKYGMDGFAFKNVPIVTPAGDTVLVKDLDIVIKPGDHVNI